MFKVYVNNIYDKFQISYQSTVRQTPGGSCIHNA